MMPLHGSPRRAQANGGGGVNYNPQGDRDFWEAINREMNGKPLRVTADSVEAYRELLEAIATSNGEHWGYIANSEW